MIAACLLHTKLSWMYALSVGHLKNLSRIGQHIPSGGAEDGSPSGSEWTDRLITALSGQVLPGHGDVDGLSLFQGASLAEFLRGHGNESLTELIATVSRRMSRGLPAENGVGYTLCH